MLLGTSVPGFEDELLPVFDKLVRRPALPVRVLVAAAVVVAVVAASVAGSKHGLERSFKERLRVQTCSHHRQGRQLQQPT